MFDESTPNLRKLLRDSDYSSALNKASGSKFVYFTLQDDVDSSGGNLLEENLEIDGTADNLSDSYSNILKLLFDEEMFGYMPSVVLFQVHDNQIVEYRLVSLNKKLPQEILAELTSMFSVISNSLNGIASENFGNRTEIFNVVANALENEKWRTMILKGAPQILGLASKIKKLLGQ